MGRLDFIRAVPGKIGEFGNDAAVKLKQLTRDGPALRSIAGDLSKEIVLKTVPGAKWLWKFAPKSQSNGSSSGELKELRERISRLERTNSKLKEMRERVSRLESKNSSLKEMSERISLLECEISSVREEKKEWQQERIMLMASMLALATDSETKPWKTRALLLTMSDLLLPSNHSVIRAEAKPED